MTSSLTDPATLSPQQAANPHHLMVPVPDTGHISPVITGSRARRTIVCPNFVKVVTRRSTRYVVVRWHTITKVHVHDDGVVTHSTTNYAVVVRGSSDIDNVRRPVAQHALGRVHGTSYCTGTGTFIVDLVTGEVVR